MKENPYRHIDDTHGSAFAQVADCRACGKTETRGKIKMGDRVRIISGTYKGSVGYVTAEECDFTTIEDGKRTAGRCRGSIFSPGDSGEIDVFFRELEKLPTEREEERAAVVKAIRNNSCQTQSMRDFMETLASLIERGAHLENK